MSAELRMIVQACKHKVSLYESQMFGIRIAIAVHEQRLTELHEARKYCLTGANHPNIGAVRNINDLYEARAAQAKIKREAAEWTLLIADCQSEMDALKETLAGISVRCSLYTRKYHKFSLCLDRYIISVHQRQHRAEENEIEEICYARTPSKR